MAAGSAPTSIGEPDADRRREHRRHRVRGAVADQGRVQVRLQRAQRRGERALRRRGRHARGDRQVQPAICPDRGPHAHRAGHQGPAAAHPRRIRAGRADRPGPAAAGRSAAGGDRRLPRRAGRARRQGEEHQRGQYLPQPGAAARQGRGGNHHPEGRGLQGAEGRQRQGRHPALQPGLRPVRQGQGHHLGAPLHRGDRGGAAQREQGADRQERRRRCRALPAPARAAVRPDDPRCRRDRRLLRLSGATR